jgi:hypothetical protein
VVDPLPRLVMKDYDYRILGDVDDDILLLEWDIAIDREGLEAFIAHTKQAPDSVAVAPYRIYQPTTRAVNLPKPFWVHRRYGHGEQTTYFVQEDEPTCHLFGLGMTYLPKRIVRLFLDSWPGHFSDASFSGWHYKNVEREVPIVWESRAAHLHYLIERY